MKKLLFAGTALVALGSQGMAADYPAPVVGATTLPPAPLFSWTGCYIGGHGGGGWGDKKLSNNVGGISIPPGESIGIKIEGAFGGGQAGCDFQLLPNWVAGVAADISWADIKGDVDDPFFANKNFKARTEWFGSAAGRLGVNVDRFMIYGLGGVAWAHDIYQARSGDSFLLTATESRNGYVVGGGMEWYFARNWSAKFEYQRLDFGTRTVTLTDGSNEQTLDVRQLIRVLKFGLNYRF
jgi:outer membrane immunogenic protein